MPKRRKIIIGEKQHGLTYLGEAPRNKHNHRMAHVVCDCGKEATINLNSFSRNKTCGNCYEENNTNHKLYEVWRSAKSRCYDKRNKSYMNYCRIMDI